MKDIGTLTGGVSIRQWYDDEKKMVQWTIGDIMMTHDGYEFAVNNITADTQKELVQKVLNAQRSQEVATTRDV
jgi:hypothetical protein